MRKFLNNHPYISLAMVSITSIAIYKVIENVKRRTFLNQVKKITIIKCDKDDEVDYDKIAEEHLKEFEESEKEFEDLEKAHEEAFEAEMNTEEKEPTKKTRKRKVESVEE